MRLKRRRGTAARLQNEKKKKKSGADERRWMDGYVRKRDRWGARQVESTIEPGVSPSLYNDTLHCAINKSMGNTCSAPLMMEILA